MLGKCYAHWVLFVLTSSMCEPLGPLSKAGSSRCLAPIYKWRWVEDVYPGKVDVRHVNCKDIVLLSRGSLDYLLVEVGVLYACVQLCSMGEIPREVFVQASPLTPGNGSSECGVSGSGKTWTCACWCGVWVVMDLLSCVLIIAVSLASVDVALFSSWVNM